MVINIPAINDSLITYFLPPHWLALVSNLLSSQQSGNLQNRKETNIVNKNKTFIIISIMCHINNQSRYNYHYNVIKPANCFILTLTAFQVQIKHKNLNTNECPFENHGNRHFCVSRPAFNDDLNHFLLLNNKRKCVWHWELSHTNDRFRNSIGKLILWKWLCIGYIARGYNCWKLNL